jgi:hypothetical protein
MDDHKDPYGEMMDFVVHQSVVIIWVPRFELQADLRVTETRLEIAARIAKPRPQ